MRPAERVPQRDPVSNHLAGSEFDVVIHQVKVSLRPDENIGGDVKS